MESMISFCGIDCAQCGAYLATQADDDAKRQEVADMWSKMHNVEIKKEDINCDGCHTVDGRLVGFCQICQVRQCGQEKSVQTCGHCSEYSCEKLDGLLKMIPHPTARQALAEINNSIFKRK